MESLFVLNCCQGHPIYQAAAVVGDGGSGISVGFEGINLNGDIGRVLADITVLELQGLAHRPRPGFVAPGKRRG